MLFLTGCEKYARHRFLTVFFTGVPHPDSENIITEEELGVLPEGAVEKSADTSSSHGPYAAQQCYQCHATAGSVTFRAVAVGEIKSSGLPTMQSMPSRLVMPIKELCIDCHTGKSVKAAFGKGLWVHGPVSEGICISCHGPHSSQYPYLLLKGSSREMCSSCHGEGFIIMTEDHLKDEECTSCHNPHVGKTRFLLKKDFDEASLK
jgi:predicted CXXCH cytochrome family protein